MRRSFVFGLGAGAAILATPPASPPATEIAPTLPRHDDDETEHDSMPGMQHEAELEKERGVGLRYASR